MTLHGPIVRWLQELAQTEQSQLLVTAAIFLGVLLFGYLVNRSGAWLKDRFDPTVVETLQTIIGGVVATVGFVAALVVWRAADDVAASMDQQDVDIGQLLATASILIGAYVLTRVTKRVIKGFARDSSAFSDHQREIAHHIVQVTVFLFAVLVVLSLWRVNLGNLLLGAGVLGVVIGLAARQTLGAVLAGFVVLFSRPFEVGDWIVVEDTEGVVRDITIVNTRIRTVDGETVMVPNDIITGTMIRNRSREGRLRIEVEVGVDYDTDVDAAMGVAVEAMDDIDIIRDAPEPHAVLDEFGDSAVVLALRFWIDNPSARRYWRARTAVVRDVKTAFDEADVTIPFPQRSISDRGDREPAAGAVAGDDGGEDEATEDE